MKHLNRFIVPVLGLLVALTLILFDATILRSGRTALRPTLQKGVALGVYRAAKGLSFYRPSIDRLSELGVTHLSLPVYFFQDSVQSVTLYPKPTDGATPEQLDGVIREIIGYAHRSGMKVFLVPIVDLEHSIEKEWRGTIAPTDWTAWFESYRAFLMHYARMADELDVEFFSVGTELVSTEGFTEEWLKTIRSVRGVYHGQLTYSANWDHYQEIAFWSELDFLGVSGYFELVAFENPTIPELVEGWIQYKEELLAWRAKWQKPLLFVEIGYTSQEGSASQPWNYIVKAPVNLEEQRRLYEAMRLTWENEPHLAGLYLWVWEPDRRGPKDTGYTIAGKPAQDVVRAWYHSLSPNATIMDIGVNAVERFLRSVRQGL